MYANAEELLTDENAKEVFSKMKELWDKYKLYDASSVCSGYEMTDIGMYIAEAMVRIPGSMMIAHYYEEMIQEFKKTTLSQAFRISQELVEQGELDQAKELLRTAQSEVDRFVTSAPEDTLSQWFTRLCSAHDNKDKQKIRLGFPVLDRFLGAMMPGQMHILGARPKVGKSIVATNIAVNVAKKGYGVLYFSLEMSMDQMLSRAVACYSKVASVSASHNLTEENISRIGTGLGDFAKLPLWFSCGVFSVRDMEEQIHKYQLEGKRIDFIIIDYLQLIKGDSKRTRYEQVTDISTGIKRLAMGLELPVLALSQLSRDSADSEPKVHHLRESGSIEQDAESIMLLWKQDEDNGDIQLLLRGNRNGDSYANISLTFNYQTLHVFETPPGQITTTQTKKNVSRAL